PLSKPKPQNQNHIKTKTISKPKPSKPKGLVLVHAYSVCSSKKQKSSFKDYYREKQQEAASTALKQASLANAVAVIKDTFPFEYLTFGNQMRGNIEYELQQIEKQKEIEYKPVYDSASFKIPEEHQDKIKEWLEYDFRMLIEGNITRSRCLFLIGPIQHGI
ncbi:unnamed protein product, partial [Rotaria magnacalcarata]